MKIKLSDHFTYKRLFKFVFPSILMMIATSLYVVIDGLFVSNYVGKTPFASINIVYPLIMILGGTGFMMGTGGTALVSKVLGEKNIKRANQYFSMTIITSIIIGITISTIGIILIRPILHIIGATGDMMEYAIIYGIIIIIFTTFFMLQNVFQSFLIAAEKPRLGLYVTLIAGLTNAILDAVFIVALKMGVVGAAIATGIGQFVGAIIPLLYFIFSKKSILKLSMTKLEIKPIIKICTNGSSELLTNIASSIITVLYNLQLLKYIGEDGVSANGILMYIQFIFVAVEIGYSIGCAPLISYNYGAKNNDELRNIFKKSMIILGILGIFFLILAQVSAIPISRIFVGYDEILCNLAIHALRLFSISFIFSGITIFSSNFFTSLNDGLISALQAILRTIVFQVIFIFLLPYLLGKDGIWLTIVASEFCSFIVAIILFATMRKKYHYI